MRRKILLASAWLVLGCTKFQTPVDGGTDNGGTGGTPGQSDAGDAAGPGGTGGAVGSGGAGGAAGSTAPDAGDATGSGGAGSTDASVTDGSSDTTCTCPGGFACSAGVCKTTCTTSADCTPHFFCDPGNGKCHSDVVSVAGGADQTCVAVRDGRAFCWGANDMGQLGIGQTGPSSTDAQQVLGLTNVSLLRATEHDTCAVTADAKVYCWGSGFFDGTGHVDPAPVPLTTSAGTPLVGVKLLSLGINEACAVTTSTTDCWSGNSLGGPTVPTPVAGAGVPSSITVTNSIAVGSYGDARACPWDVGGNPMGQCFSTGSPVAEVSSNDITMYARLTTGVVISWGSNAYGLLGNGMAALPDASPPGVVVSNLNAASVVASYITACAIPSANQRSVVCWGVVGGANVSSPTAVTITLPSGLAITDLGSGMHSVWIYAIISDGSLQGSTYGASFTQISANW